MKIYSQFWAFDLRRMKADLPNRSSERDGRGRTHAALREKFPQLFQPDLQINIARPCFTSVGAT
jgi:hypothetical protein